MITKLGLATFLLTATLGTIFVHSEKFSNLFRHECAHWTKETLARPLFSLNEAKQFLGRKVYDERASAHPGNNGRIRHLEMVCQNKFFLMVDWEVAPDDGRESLRFYDKEDLAKLSIED